MKIIGVMIALATAGYAYLVNAFPKKGNTEKAIIAAGFALSALLILKK